MSWTLVDSGTAAFADGAGGHVFNYPGGAPTEGNLLVLCVNSDATVATPSGWTLAISDVQSQGAYLFYKVAGAGEASSVTVTTGANVNSSLGYLAYTGNTASPLDVTAKAASVASGASTTPAVSTGALAETGELVVAHAGLHNHSGTTPTSPVWSTGFTNRLTANSIAGAGGGAALFVADTRNAGTAAETPNCSWTGGVPDQTILVATFKASSEAPRPTTGKLAAGAAGAGGTAKVAGTSGAVAAGAAGAGGMAKALTTQAVAAVALAGAGGTGKKSTTQAALPVAAAGAGAASKTSNPTGALALGAAGAGLARKLIATAGTLWAGVAGRGATVNGTLAPSLLANNELVTVQWLRTAYSGWDSLVASAVPRNNSTWAASGFVQVVAAVGGTSTPYVPLKQPIMQIDCWAVNPTSGKPPWGKAHQLAELIRAACFDEARMRRLLTLPGDFPPARVLEAYLVSEPRRMWSDDASYSRFSFDLQLHWVEVPR